MRDIGGGAIRNVVAHMGRLILEVVDMLNMLVTNGAVMVIIVMEVGSI